MCVWAGLFFILGGVQSANIFLHPLHVVIDKINTSFLAQRGERKQKRVQMFSQHWLS